MAANPEGFRGGASAELAKTDTSRLFCEVRTGILIFAPPARFRGQCLLVSYPTALAVEKEIGAGGELDASALYAENSTGKPTDPHDPAARPASETETGQLEKPGEQDIFGRQDERKMSNPYRLTIEYDGHRNLGGHFFRRLTMLVRKLTLKASEQRISDATGPFSSVYQLLGGWAGTPTHADSYERTTNLLENG